MASSDDRRSVCSTADSGISSSYTDGPVDPRYACNWTKTCLGQHEIDDCAVRRRELRGKLGIYHSPCGIWKRFRSCQIGHDLSLEHNPTGCTMAHLLIHTIENNEPWILFAIKFVKEKRPGNDGPATRQSLLTLPSFYPSNKGEDPKRVALKALKTVTDWQETEPEFRKRLKGFLFCDASVIYPISLTDDQAKKLTSDFTRNECVTSVHWFRLSTVLNSLPEWDDYLIQKPSQNELEQVKHPHCGGIRLSQNNEEYTIWSVTAFYLLCIRNYLGFETFLK